MYRYKILKEQETETILEAIETDPTAIKYLDLNNNPKLLLELLEENPKIGEKFNDLLSDKAFILKSLGIYPNIAKYMHPDLKKDDAFLLEVAEVNTYAAALMKKGFRIDNKDLLLRALKKQNNYKPVRYANEALSKNVEVMLEAITLNPESIRYVSFELKTNTQFLLSALQNRIDVKYYIKQEAWDNANFCLEAMDIDLDLIKMSSDKLKKG